MNIRGLTAACLAVVLLGASPSDRLTVYSAPAGIRPAGTSFDHPTDAILPNGRIAAPAGDSIFVGSNPLGVALSPDGRYAIVSNNDQDVTRPVPAGADFVAGYSLAVVDTRTMRISSVYRDPSAAFFVGIAALKDPADPARTIVLASEGANDAVQVFDLSAAGSLAPESQSIPLARGTFPASIALDPTNRVAYVAGNRAGTVTSIDIALRAVLHTEQVGYQPFGVAASTTNVYVTNGGLSTYHPLARTARVPQFAQPIADADKSSSLSVIPRAIGGDSALAATVRMDTPLDGVHEIGGDRPGAIALRRDGRYGYVALSNVDRVAIVGLLGEAHVVGGLDLRLFPDAPYGTEPSAVALAPDSKRLYVALAGLDAVAVLDAHNPVVLHRLGLIPTGWYPSAMAISPDGRYLYVTAAKGVDRWGILQRIDLRKTNLMKTTLAALKYQRTAAVAIQNPAVPPMRSNDRSNVIDHVVYISMGTTTFDALLGDAQNNIYPLDVTPNMHALATAYGLADNMYADDANLDINRLFALGGTATLYAQQTLPVNSGRAPLDAHGQDPEDYARSGDLFDALARGGISFRDYGEMLQLSGYSDAQSASGLGGDYALDVPALASLSGNVDLNYPIAGVTGSRGRAAEFINDMGRLVDANSEPTFSYVSLPAGEDRGSVAGADRALGAIVAFLSRTPHWSSTAIFVVPAGVAGVDHVNEFRSYAMVISPLAKPGYIGHNHLSVASVVKTEEELLGLAPLSLNDFLATDMADFFRDVPYPTAYTAIP